MDIYYLNIYFSRLIPQVAENAAARALSEAKAYVGRRPTPKACRRAKSQGREGGRGGIAGERESRRIYTRWLEARGLPSRGAKPSVETRCLPSRRERERIGEFIKTYRVIKVSRVHTVLLQKTHASRRGSS